VCSRIRPVLGATAALLLPWVSGCGDEETGGPTTTTTGSTTTTTDVEPAGCAPGETPIGEEVCAPAGVTECAPGFETDGAQGCQPILPGQPCAEGTMATPGDSECRPVAPCDDGTWGSIPVDGQTQHVDASYTGGNADGSADRPWATIQAGVDAAAPGAIVAIAEGTYAERVTLAGKAARLWGRCPERVTIAGPAGFGEAIRVTNADGAEIRDLAVTGAATGLFVSGGDVLLDRLWVHHTGGGALRLQNDQGATSVTLSRSLVEQPQQYAIFVGGSSCTIDQSVLQDVQLAGGGFGATIAAQDSPIDGSPATLVLTASLLARGVGVGVLVSGADLSAQAAVIADTQPNPDQTFGRCLSIQEGVGSHRSTANLDQVVIDGCHDTGLLVAGADLVMDGSVVRGVGAASGAEPVARGVSLKPGDEAGEPATGVIGTSVIAAHEGAGVALIGSELQLDSSVVRDILPAAAVGTFGRGIQVQPGTGGQLPSLTVRWSVVEHAHEAGIAIVDGTATIEATALGHIVPQLADQRFGDGIIVVSLDGASTLSLLEAGVSANARAGLSCHGSTATVEGTEFECNPIHLNGEPYLGSPTQVEDLGGNACGCEAETVECTIASAQLEPPGPLPSAGP